MTDAAGAQRVEAWHGDPGHQAAFPKCEACVLLARLRAVEAEKEVAVSEMIGLREVLRSAEGEHEQALKVVVEAKDMLAAESRRLQEELDDSNGAYRAVMDEACAGGITYGTDDRLHCTCVPHLREGVGALRKALEFIAKTSDARTVPWEPSTCTAFQDIWTMATQALAASAPKA